MVQRQWVLLTLLMSCSVDRLNIHVPKRGVESINQEDLRRAVWRLQFEDPSIWWENRAPQIGISPVENTPYCYSHSGEYVNGTQIYLEEQTPLDLAILASWAKSMHGVETSVGWHFCLSQPDEKSGWRKAHLQTLFSYEDQSFTDIQFDVLEQRLRQQVEHYWDGQ